jgi:hypothetical protein
MTTQKWVGLPIISEVDEVVQTLTSLPRTDETTPLEFRIVPRPGHLVLPNMRINEQLEIWKYNAQGKRERPTYKDSVCLVDFAGMTRYKLIEVYINGVLITRNHYSHGIISYIRGLTEFTKYEKDNILRLAGWLPNTGLALGTENVNTDRLAMTLRDKIDLLSPMLVDVFNHNQPFPDDVEILIKMHRAPREWVLNGPPRPGWNFEINVLKAELLITRLQMEPGIDIYNRLGGNIMFRYPAYEPRMHVIMDKVTSVNEEILDGQPLPDKVICLYIDQAGYNGDYLFDPLQFDHLYTREFNLRRDDLYDIPPVPYKFDEVPNPAGPITKRAKRSAPVGDAVVVGGDGGDNESVVSEGGDDGGSRDKRAVSDYLDTRMLGNYSRAYAEVMRGLGDFDKTRISYERFTNGLFIQAFDTRVDRDPAGPPPKQPDRVNLRFQAKLHRGVGRPYMLVVLFLNHFVYSLSRGGRVKQT